ncbi:Uncharacterized membrane protein, YraQ family [hydrothermal vent metagenome]|uniref:Uncharacterized membrane protein, YraQ family n=1 Tax=hydrothermal vent metagenome TaxID=652676 RepID=A0A3B0R6P0_9ZZZZ
MVDSTQPLRPARRIRVDKVWVALAIILLMVAVLDGPQFGPTVRFAASALLSTAPFIAFAVLAVAYMKASEAETLLARVFGGRQSRMILVAALLGGLSPFCSCEVIPFIAAMLALGAPLAAVMAFWLSSPLMDPAMFMIILGTLGWKFAVAKIVAEGCRAETRFSGVRVPVLSTHIIRLPCTLKCPNSERKCIK